MLNAFIDFFIILLPLEGEKPAENTDINTLESCLSLSLSTLTDIQSPFTSVLVSTSSWEKYRLQ